MADNTSLDYKFGFIDYENFYKNAVFSTISSSTIVKAAALYQLCGIVLSSHQAKSQQSADAPGDDGLGDHVI